MKKNLIFIKLLFFVTCSTAGFIHSQTIGFATINSGSGDESQNVTLTVTISSSVDAQVSYRVKNGDEGTATGGGTDYTLNNGILVFSSGGATTKTFSITINDDNMDEDPETIKIELHSVSPFASLPTTEPDTIDGIAYFRYYEHTIINNDDPPTVELNATSTQYTEEDTGGNTETTIRVDLNPASSKDVSINYTVADGTAEVGSDYTLSSGIATINNGDTYTTITVQIMGDTKYEENENFTVTLANTATNANVGTNKVHTFYIQNDDSKPKVYFSVETNSGLENSNTSHIITITQSAVSGLTTTIPYTTTGTATNGTDYGALATSGSATISVDNTSTTLTIDLTSASYDDDIWESPDETIIITMGTPTNADLHSTNPTVHTFTINEDDSKPKVEFVNGGTDGSDVGEDKSEETASWNIAISLDRESSSAITIPFTIAGTATAGTDYTQSETSNFSSSYTIAANTGAGTINIPLVIVDESIHEANETIVLDMGTVTGADKGTNVEYTYTINNDDSAPDISFGTDASGYENSAGTVTVPVTLTTAAEVEARVNYAVSTSSTADGSDYSLTAGTLSFAAGNTTPTSALTFTVIGDTYDEENETVIIDLSSHAFSTSTPDWVSGTNFGGNGGDNDFTYTITDDDDPPIVSFESDLASVTEGGTGSINVNLNTASKKTVKIVYSVSGTAVAGGEDYTLASDTLTFNPDDTQETISIPTTADALDEINETVVLTLGSQVNCTIGTPGTYTLTISDDDPPPTIEFTTDVSNGNEDSNGTATIRINSVSAKKVSIPYSISGTALGSGTDYTLAAGTAYISAGEQDSVLIITVNNDSLYETNENVIITLGTPTNATLGATYITHTYTINDNDEPPIIQFAAGSDSTSENTASVNIEVGLNEASGLDVSAAFTVVDSSADGNTDFTLADGTVIILAGARSANIALDITNDLYDEIDETLRITLSSNPSNAALGETVSHIHTILDNDNPPGIAFSTGSSTVGEGTTPTTLTLVLDAESGKNISVDYTIAGNSTASEGSDYTLEPDQTVTILAGSLSNTFDINIINDILDEASEEIIIDLTDPPTNATLALPKQYTLTITDNDDLPTVFFSATNPTSGNEDGGSIVVTVEINTPSGQDVSVVYAVSGGTATGNGTDYTFTSGTAIITAGNSDTTFSFTIADDDLDENDETVIFDLSGATNATLGADTIYTYEIIDNDSLPELNFTLGSSNGSEGTTPVNMEINIDALSGRDVNVNYVVTGGDADSSGVDYTLAAGTATITEGSLTTNISMIVNDDLLDEIDETVNVSLNTPVNTTLGDTTTHIYTIQDNDSPPIIAFSTVSSTGAESASTVQFYVDISTASGKDISVNYAASGGTADSSGVDYTLNYGTININAGDTIDSLSANIVNDLIDESNETFLIELSSPVDATMGDDSVHTYTIADDDDSPTAFTVGSVTTVGGNIRTGYWNANNTGLTIAVPIENTADLNDGRVQILVGLTVPGFTNLGSSYTIQSGELGDSAFISIDSSQFNALGFAETNEVLIGAAITDINNNSTIGTESGTTVTIDTTAPAELTTGAVTTIGGNVVSEFWNGTNTAANIAVPIPNDLTLIGGTVQIQGYVEGIGAIANLGILTSIAGGDISGNLDVQVSTTELEAINGFNNDETLLFRAEIIDQAGNLTTDSISTTTLYIDTTSSTAILSYSHTLVSEDTVVTINAEFDEDMELTPLITVNYQGTGGSDIVANPMTIVGNDSSEWEFNITIPGASFIDDGIVTVNITATDIAGNDLLSGDISNSAVLVVDNSPPEVSFVYENLSQPTLANLGKTGDLVRITATFNEPMVVITNPLAIQYSDSTVNYNVDSTPEDTSWIFEITLVKTDTVNNYDLQLSMTCTDSAGNLTDYSHSTSNNSVFQIDDVVPIDFATGDITTIGFNEVTGWINGRTDSIAVTLPISPSDGSLLNGGNVDIQMRVQLKMIPDTWTTIASSDSIPQAGTFTVYRTVTSVSNDVGVPFENGDTLLIRAVISDKVGNQTQGTTATQSLIYDPNPMQEGVFIGGNIFIPDTLFSNDTLSAVWANFNDGLLGQGSGLEHYEIATEQIGDATINEFSDWENLLLVESVVKVDPLVHNTQYRFHLRAFDVAGNVSDTLVSNAKRRLNSAPVIAAVDSQSVNEDSTVTVQFNAADLDLSTLLGDTLHYTIIDTGINNNINPLTINEYTGLFSWNKPLQADTGSYTVQVRAADEWGFADTTQFVITVISINDAPKLTFTTPSDQITFSEDHTDTVRINLTPFASDTDNDSSQFVWRVERILGANPILGYPMGTVATDTSGGVITVSLDTINGSIYATFDADSNYFGSNHAVIFSVSDPNSASATDTIFISISNVNDAPIWQPIEKMNVTENDSLKLDFAQYISDIDDTTMTFKVSALTNAGFMTITPSSYSSVDIGDTTLFKPALLWSDTARIQVIGTDAGGLADTTRFTIDIIRVKRPELDFSVIPNNAFPNFFDVIITDTVGTTAVCSLEVQGQIVPLDTVGLFTWVGNSLFEFAGTYTFVVGAIGIVGDTSITEQVGLTVAKMNVGWSGSSPDGDFHIEGTPGAVNQDQTLVIMDTSMINKRESDALYRITSASEQFELPVEIKVGSTEDLAIYHSRFGAAWEELPSITQDDQILAYSVKTGYFKLDQKTIFVPEITNIHQNYPNPFNPYTTIEYDLGFFDGPLQRVNVSVYNLLGQHVRTLVNEIQSVGRYTIRWNGRNDENRQISSGVYFVRMMTDKGMIKTRKVMLIR